ncbi:hypothetical protein [Streptomyces sp. NPDC048603]|uniref:hypothetical protein n=1 Tax=Streptomyces sp. NPDC048603 TaxID=3365577 RepID=UPI003715BEE6
MSRRTEYSTRYLSAPPAVTRAAIAGAAGAVPYVAMKLYWSWGGTAGKPIGMNLADEFAKNGAPRVLVWLERHGIDFTAVGVMLGITLLGALTRPWGQIVPRWMPGLRGRRVPRWLLLVPGWASAVTLAPYGSLGLAVIVTGGLSTAHTAGMSPMVFVIGFLNFFSIGVSLGVCSLSYQRRTKLVPAC